MTSDTHELAANSRTARDRAETGARDLANAFHRAGFEVDVQVGSVENDRARLSILDIEPETWHRIISWLCLLRDVVGADE